MTYSFPVEKVNEALDVLGQDFKINLSDEGVYVDLDQVRGRKFIDRMLFTLCIKNGVLEKGNNQTTKIIFSGHRGTGKSVELRRFHKSINSPDKYLSIFIEGESIFQAEVFSPVDLFIVLIASLIDEIEKREMKFNSKELDNILEEWTNEEEIINELIDDYRIDLKSEVEAGASFFGFLKVKNALKALFSTNSRTTHILRKKINKNTFGFINRLNIIFDELRNYLYNINQGNDIIFIFDGTEKIVRKAYKKLFLEQSFLIKELNCSMIFSVPIHAYYDITTSLFADFFNTYTIPMVPVNDKSTSELKKIISKRIEISKFIDSESLNFCVSQSGGCIRQLIKLVNRSIVYSLGEKVTIETAKEAAFDLGKDIFDRFNKEHLEILKSGNYRTADTLVKEMLFSLALLDFEFERKINPLLHHFIRIDACQY